MGKRYVQSSQWLDIHRNSTNHALLDLFDTHCHPIVALQQAP